MPMSDRQGLQATNPKRKTRRQSFGAKKGGDVGTEEEEDDEDVRRRAQ
jgi:hypothetical protein